MHRVDVLLYLTCWFHHWKIKVMLKGVHSVVGFIAVFKLATIFWIDLKFRLQQMFVEDVMMCQDAQI